MKGLHVTYLDRSRGGQTLVIFALALTALLAMSALIVDAGNAFAQQRGTQNGADAASEAGATVIAQSLLSTAAGQGPRTDAQVLAAMNSVAAIDNIRPFNPGVSDNSKGYYTDISGNLLTSSGATTTDPAQAVQVGAAAGNVIPQCNANCVGSSAAGVQAVGNRPFPTVMARVIGFTSFTATTAATAVAGYGPSVCDAPQGCALLPVTFSTTRVSCSNSGDTNYSQTPWTIAVPDANGNFNNADMVILGLCKNGPGAVGWIDFGCGNLASQIQNPCNASVPIPTWLQTQPGNNNSLDDELAAYYGREVLIPFFDGTCNQDRPDNEAPGFPLGAGVVPGVCVGGTAGSGANRYYHIPYFLGFHLYATYTSGNNGGPCNSAPGSPFVSGNGGNGCFKGWITRLVAGPGAVSVNPQPGSPATPLSITLIK